MATVRAQPIAGVTTGAENEIMSVYPSIGSTGLGRLLGRLFESIPLGKCPVKLSHLLFALPLSPLALLLYVQLKLTGVRYMLTNRAVVLRSVLSGQERGRVDLADIAEVQVQQQDGQYFYRCADLYLLRADGDVIRTLEGVQRADVFRQSIIKARDAAVQVKASLAAIDARHAQ